jgi:large subunit ribosomal protein L15
MNRRGYKNRTKGSGNRGGYGMAGTGKRGDQRKTLVINLYGNNYFGKKLSTSKAHKIPSISLRSLHEKLSTLVKEGKAKETNGKYEITFKGYKIIGNEELKLKLHIHARAASESALASVKAAGGDIIFDKQEI